MIYLVISIRGADDGVTVRLHIDVRKPLTRVASIIILKKKKRYLHL